MMGKLISQQAAIDTLKELTANGTNKGMIFGEDAVHRIEMLPSIQPDTTTHDSIPAKTGGNDGDRTSGDCISRQQAIDAVSNCGICIQRIVDLPSAQPEHKAVFNRDIAIEAICDEAMLRFDVSATQAYEIAETAVKRIEVRMEKMNRGEKDG